MLPVSKPERIHTMAEKITMLANGACMLARDTGTFAIFNADERALGKAWSLASGGYGVVVLTLHGNNAGSRTRLKDEKSWQAARDAILKWHDPAAHMARSTASAE
jgi:hypothetical protein